MVTTTSTNNLPNFLLVSKRSGYLVCLLVAEGLLLHACWTDAWFTERQHDLPIRTKMYTFQKNPSALSNVARTCMSTALPISTLWFSNSLYRAEAQIRSWRRRDIIDPVNMLQNVTSFSEDGQIPPHRLSIGFYNTKITLRGSLQPICVILECRSWTGTNSIDLGFATRCCLNCTAYFPESHVARTKLIALCTCLRLTWAQMGAKHSPQCRLHEFFWKFKFSINNVFPHCKAKNNSAKHSARAAHYTKCNEPQWQLSKSIEFSYLWYLLCGGFGSRAETRELILRTPCTDLRFVCPRISAKPSLLCSVPAMGNSISKQKYLFNADSNENLKYMSFLFSFFDVANNGAYEYRKLITLCTCRRLTWAQMGVKHSPQYTLHRQRKIKGKLYLHSDLNLQKINIQSFDIESFVSCTRHCGECFAPIRGQMNHRSVHGVLSGGNLEKWKISVEHPIRQISIRSDGKWIRISILLCFAIRTSIFKNINLKCRAQTFGSSVHGWVRSILRCEDCQT